MLLGKSIRSRPSIDETFSRVPAMATELADVIVADATAEDDLTDGRGGFYHNVLSAIHYDIDNDEPEERIGHVFRAMHATPSPTRTRGPRARPPSRSSPRTTGSTGAHRPRSPTDHQVEARAPRPTAPSRRPRRRCTASRSCSTAGARRAQGRLLVLKARAFSGSQCSEAIASATFARAAPKTSASRARPCALPDAAVGRPARGACTGWMRDRTRRRRRRPRGVGRAAAGRRRRCRRCPAPATIAVGIVQPAPGDALERAGHDRDHREPRACADQEQREPRPRAPPRAAAGSARRTRHARLPRAAPSLAARVAAALTGGGCAARPTDVSLEVASGVTAVDAEQPRSERCGPSGAGASRRRRSDGRGRRARLPHGSALAHAGEELLDVVDYRGALRRKSARWRRAIGAHPDGRINLRPRDGVKPSSATRSRRRAAARARPRETAAARRSSRCASGYGARRGGGPEAFGARALRRRHERHGQGRAARPCACPNARTPARARAVMTAASPGDDNVDREARVGSQSVEIDLGELSRAAGAPGRGSPTSTSRSGRRCRRSRARRARGAAHRRPSAPSTSCASTRSRRRATPAGRDGRASARPTGRRADAVRHAHEGQRRRLRAARAEIAAAARARERPRSAAAARGSAARRAVVARSPPPTRRRGHGCRARPRPRRSPHPREAAMHCAAPSRSCDLRARSPFSRSTAPGACSLGSAKFVLASLHRAISFSAQALVENVRDGLKTAHGRSGIVAADDQPPRQSP